MRRLIFLATIILCPRLGFAQSPGGLPINGPAASTPASIGAVPGKSLLQFGAAIGDGSSASAAMLAAMASSSPVKINIPEGTFGLASGTEYVAGAAHSLVGAGADKTTLQLPANCTQQGPLFYWLGRSVFTISDLTLDLNHCSAAGYSPSSLLAYVIGLRGTNLARIERVKVINAGAFLPPVTAAGASASGSTLTVPGSSLTLPLWSDLSGGGLIPHTVISGQGSCSAGNCTYTYTPPQTIGGTFSVTATIGSAGWFLVGLNGDNNTTIADNYFSLDAASHAPNQCMNISDALSLGDGLVVMRNRCVNTGIEAFTSNSRYEFNNVSGWQYGGGFGISQVTDSLASAHNVVAHNTIHDSGTGMDSNSTWLNAVEAWGPDTTIDDNDIYNVSGSILMGGPRQHVVNNKLTGTGKRNDGSPVPAITCQNYSTTFNCSGSELSGNRAVDDGTGTMPYGYGDVLGITGVSLATSNVFVGSQGSYNIRGGSQVIAPSTDNRIGNPCFAVNQLFEGGLSGNVGGTKVFVTDRWAVTSAVGDVNYSRASVSLGGCKTALSMTIHLQDNAPVAANSDVLSQAIEANDLADIFWGNTQARSIVVDWCDQYPVAGTFSGAVQNFNAHHFYAFNYTVYTAGQPQCFSLVVPGDPAGALPGAGATAGLNIAFNIGAGSNYLTSTPYQWVTSGTAIVGTTTSAYPTASAAGSIFYKSAVCVVPGTSDAGCSFAPYRAALAKDQAYVWKSFADGVAPVAGSGGGASFLSAPALAGGSAVIPFTLPPQTRLTPTCTAYSPGVTSSSNAYDSTSAVPAGAATVNVLSAKGGYVSVAPAAGVAAGDILQIHLFCTNDLN